MAQNQKTDSDFQSNMAQFYAQLSNDQKKQFEDPLGPFATHELMGIEAGRARQIQNQWKANLTRFEVTLSPQQQLLWQNLKEQAGQAGEHFQRPNDGIERAPNVEISAPVELKRELLKPDVVERHLHLNEGENTPADPNYQRREMIREIKESMGEERYKQSLQEGKASLDTEISQSAIFAVWRIGSPSDHGGHDTSQGTLGSNVSITGDDRGKLKTEFTATLDSDITGVKSVIPPAPSTEQTAAPQRQAIVSFVVNS